MNDYHPLAVRFYAATETYHFDARVHCDSDEFAAFVKSNRNPQCVLQRSCLTWTD